METVIRTQTVVDTHCRVVMAGGKLPGDGAGYSAAERTVKRTRNFEVSFTLNTRSLSHPLSDAVACTERAVV